MAEEIKRKRGRPKGSTKTKMQQKKASKLTDTPNAAKVSPASVEPSKSKVKPKPIEPMQEPYLKVLDGGIKANEVWERLPDESLENYNRFCAYRDLGIGRTLKQAVEVYGLEPQSLATFEALSSKYNWKFRVGAFDEFINSKAIEAAQAEIIEMRKRHLLVATAFQAKAVEALKKINPEELSPKEILSWVSKGVEIERTAREMPVAIHKTVTEQEKEITKEKESEIVDKVLTDPRFTSVLCEISEQVASSTSDTG